MGTSSSDPVISDGARARDEDDPGRQGGSTRPPRRVEELPGLPGVFSEPPRRPSSAPPPGESELLAGRYKLLGELGRGGIGVVHKALDTRTGETVAVKFLQDDSARDGSVLDRLIQEVGLVRKLKHPSICQVHCLASHEGRPFLAMEILRGPDLGEYLAARGGRLPAAQAIAMLEPVAEALDQAHRSRVVHLDLKPGNLKFDRPPEDGGVLKILDFGLARSRPVGSSATKKQKLGGSRAYCAPEQSEVSTPRVANDVYSLAVTVYEMLAGAPPFLGPDLDERKGRGVVPAIAGVRAGVMRVIRRGLSPRPAERPASAGELLRALRGAEEASWLPWILLGAVVLVAAASLALRLGGS
jgi:serine/threonine-protein kinase